MTKERHEDNDRPIPLIYKTNTDPSRRTIVIALEHGLQLNISTLSGSKVQYDKKTSEILAEEDDGSKPPRYIKVDLSQPDRTRSYQGTREETSNEQVKFLLRQRTLLNYTTGSRVKVYELTRLDDYYRLTPLNSFSNISFEDMMDHYNNWSKRLNKFYPSSKIGRDAAAKDKEKADRNVEEDDEQPECDDIKTPNNTRKSRQIDFNEENDDDDDDDDNDIDDADEDLDARELDYGTISCDSENETEPSSYISINGNVHEQDYLSNDTNLCSDWLSQFATKSPENDMEKMESECEESLSAVLQNMGTDKFFDIDDGSELEVEKNRNVGTAEFTKLNMDHITDSYDSDSSSNEQTGQ